MPARCFPVLCLLLTAFCVVLPAASTAGAPRIFGLPPDALALAKERVARGDAALKSAMDQLRADADAALALKPASVLDKTRVAASGDKHDFFSMGPYWWPNPETPDGLPYVRRDGEVNPESREGTDGPAFSRTCRAVWTLGLAYYLTGDEACSRQAALLTRTWFIAPATRMNPHLEYGQAIPGITTGRDIGIIDTRGLVELTDGIGLLAGSPAWTASDERELRAWMAAYLDWLLTSAHGRGERKKGNNHGTWYDVQVAQLALFLGRDELARATLRESLHTRFAVQIGPDGGQPHELARTLSLLYSAMNLQGFVTLAFQGEHVGVDAWNFSTADGRGLRKAVGFIAPYADPERPWIKDEIKPTPRSSVRDVLARAAIRCRDGAIRGRLREAMDDGRFAAERWNLFAPAAREPGLKSLTPAAADET